MTPSRHHDNRIRPVGDLVDRLGPGPLTVLGVWAHPDDESLLAGGLLAEVARRGGQVVTVTATAGEHGTDDPVREPPAELAARRVGELDAALRVLGADPAIHLGYGDGSCNQATERLAAHLVGRIVDRVRPDAVVTFGPDGVTGHPDHRAVGRWVRRAIADRDDRVPLVTVAAHAAWSPEAIERLHTIDAFWPGHPAHHHGGGASDGHAVVGLDDELLALKLGAIGSHASQMQRVAETLGPDHLRELAAVECYVATTAETHARISQELEPTAA